MSGKLSTLEVSLSKALDRRRKDGKLRGLKPSSSSLIDFSSNDFLSLATNEQFRTDYLRELKDQYLPTGSTGSRLLDGNSEYAETLEQEIASFHNASTALLVGSGFDANVSVFTCLPQPGDCIVYDELIHASVHDGMRASRATSFISFKHNDLLDFRSKLDLCSRTINGHNIFVALESVYSMDGDVAPLQEMVSIVKEIFKKSECHLIVDEAHSNGVFGPNGRGLVCQLGLEQDIFIRLHTFGKALACSGAAILCSDLVRTYLINYARPIIFTTFMSYPSLVAIKVAYTWMITGQTELLAKNLRQLIQHLFEQLATLRPIIEKLVPGTVVIPETCPDSAIFALIMEHPKELAAHCQSSGFMARAVMHPTVPLGTQRVRICLHAGNTKEQIDDLLLTIRKWLENEVKRVRTDRSIPNSSVSLPLNMISSASKL